MCLLKRPRLIQKGVPDGSRLALQDQALAQNVRDK